jgi:hypothetical protein
MKLMSGVNTIFVRKNCLFFLKVSTEPGADLMLTWCHERFKSESQDLDQLINKRMTRINPKMFVQLPSKRSCQ